jgi:hypothetical protein
MYYIHATPQSNTKAKASQQHRSPQALGIHLLVLFMVVGNLIRRDDGFFYK